MPALSNARHNALNSVINEMFDRACHYHSAPDLTTRDIFQMLVKPEDIPRLERLENEVKSLGIYGAETSLSHVVTSVKSSAGNVKLYVSLAEPIKGLLPAYATEGFHKKVSPEHLAAVNAWVETRTEVGRKFANLYSFISDLNNRVSSLSAMKFYFEGITALFEQTEFYKDVADRLREAPMPGKIPSIPPAMRKYGLAATKTVSWGLLFPLATSGQEKPITFSIPKQGYNTWVPSEFGGGNIYIW